MQSEIELQSQAIKYLEANGYLVTRFTNKSIHGRRVKRLGVPDLICCSPSGRWVSIELKTLTGKQSEDQIKFQQDVIARGGISLVIRTLDELVTFVEHYKRFGIPA